MPDSFKKMSPTSFVRVKIDLVELLMMDLSATNNTPVDEHETMIVVEELTKARVEAAMTGCPPMGG